MSERKIKTFKGVEVKDADQGLVEAVFATYNVKDHDGDVTLPGAFEDGAEVVISAYGHASWGPSRGASSVPKLPVGMGKIRIDGDNAVLDGEFFLETADARETFAVVKRLGARQEWSYGYDTLEAAPGTWEGEPAQLLSKQLVHEVSPVLLGAGLGTHTVAVKATDLSFVDEADHALGSVEAFIKRAQSLGSLRAGEKEGRQLSAANRRKLADLLAGMTAAAEEVDVLLRETDPNKHRDALLAEQFRFELARMHKR